MTASRIDSGEAQNGAENWFWRDILAIVAIGVIANLLIIAIPGFYSHDELDCSSGASDFEIRDAIHLRRLHRAGDRAGLGVGAAAVRRARATPTKPEWSFTPTAAFRSGEGRASAPADQTGGAGRCVAWSLADVTVEKR
jgi:hypothetical protein